MFFNHWRCQTWPWLVDAVALATAGRLRAVVPEAVLFARSAAEVPQGAATFPTCHVCHVLSGAWSSDIFRH